VQGEGGFIPATAEFVRGLRAVCDEHGIVLVCDEVQSGFARTGTFFAIEHFGVEPDLITVAKSIAMGIPLSGVLGKAEIMDAPADGAVGGTYVGNPVAQAAALAVLDVIEDERIVAHVRRVGALLRERLDELQARTPSVLAVRGLGLLAGVELDDPERARRVVDAMRDAGVLVGRTGPRDDVLKIRPPLVFADEHVGLLVGALDTALASS